MFSGTGYTSFRSTGPAASRPQRLYSKIGRHPYRNRTGILKLNGVGTNFGVGIGEARPKGVRAGDGVLGEGTASPSSPTRGYGAEPRPPRGFLVFCAVRLPFPASQYVLHTVCMARY